MSDKVKNIVITILFLLVVIGVFFINLFKEDIKISISERRNLEQFPEFSLESLIDGDFIEKFDNYTMDQFIERDNFRKLKNFAEINLFRKLDSNGIYQYDDSIIQQEYPLNESSVLNFTKRINNVKDLYLDEDNKIYYSIIPDKNYFTDESKYLKMDYKKLKEILRNNLLDMRYINIFDKLELSDYYYTDTHWKQENLIDVVNEIVIAMSVNEYIKSNYTEEIITDFDGVYSGQLQLDNKSDSIKILRNDVIDNCEVYDINGNKLSGIYDFSKINSNDKYDIFLSGAIPFAKIENPNSKSDKELIIFRDSFGSSLIPLMVESYKTIEVVDIRYINSSILGEYMEFDNKDVLFLYSTLVINNSVSLR